VDVDELEVEGRDFGHRVLNVRVAEGAFDLERSEFMRVGRVIITVTRHAFHVRALLGRAVFRVEELGSEIFATGPVVDFLTRSGAKGLGFTRVWTSADRR
jgi:hypothetical protein